MTKCPVAGFQLFTPRSGTFTTRDVGTARHPSRAAFLSMMTSPEYAAPNVDRENGVEDHVILAANQTSSKLTQERG